jgi:hypothetical protein
MTRLGCLLLLSMFVNTGAAAGQTPPAKPETDEAKKEAAAAPQATTAPAAQVSPKEGFKLGLYEGHSEIEVGYRWVSDTAGNRDVYRSMVNLGDGPKLLRSRIALRSTGSGALFDKLDLSLDSWGGEPYNTMRLSFGRSDLYQFRADYRNLNYFNFLPTFANPVLGDALLGNRLLLGQHSLNVTYRSTDLELRLFPNSRIRPYVGYSRSSGFGPGFTTTEFTGNEFLLSTDWRYAADDYRGGVDLTLWKLNLTLEQGYRYLRNDTAVAFSGDTAGNTNRPFLGNPVTLDSLNRGYHDRTSMPFSKVIAKFSPFDNLRFTGRYIYSMADVDGNSAEVASGSFVTLAERLIYRAASDSFDTRAKRPDHNGAFVAEFSPFSRLTLIDQFDTRRHHVSGSALLATLFLGARSLAGPGGPARDITATDIAESFISFEQLRNQAEVEFELGRGFSARGGHRYTFAETTLRDTGDDNVVERSADYTQNTGIAGLAFRRGRWMHLSLDYEKNDTNGVLTRTDLLDFDQVRFQWRLGPWKHISTTGRVFNLRNSNLQNDVDLRSHNRNFAFEVNYEPTERFSLSVDYSRASIYSNIAILLPQTLELDRSLFDERTHGVGGSIGVGLYRGSRVDFGYRGILNLGSYPLNYHQPFASITVPMQNGLAFRTYWQYFGYNEKGFSLQDHRTHLVTFSLAYSY